MKKIPHVILIALLSHNLTSQSLRALYQEGVTAYERKDYEIFEKKMRTIDSLRPNYPPIVYNLAVAYSFLNEHDKSIQKLNQYILMNANQAFEDDEDFSSLTKNPSFHRLIKNRKKLSEEIPVEVSQEIDILSSHPESITYSKKLKAFLIGGVRDGKIWKVEESKDPVVWLDSGNNSWSIMGLDISNDGRSLWACTSAMENYKGLKESDKGKVSVLKYDIESRTVLQTFTMPANHTFGDLITDKKGNIYVSDGTVNHLYKINEGEGKIELFLDLSEKVYNLQGIDFNSNQTHLFVSDYIDGIYKLNLDTKGLIKIKTNDNVLLKGIDGLYYRDGTLIGLHNGTQPNRIIQYRLDESETSIESKEIIAQAGILGEPTQGVFVSGKLHFIANSPWTAYDSEGNFIVESQDIIIGVIE